VLFLLVGIEAIASEPSVLISPRRSFPAAHGRDGEERAGMVEGSFRGKQLHFNPAKGAAKAVTGIDLNRARYLSAALTVDVHRFPGTC